MTEIGGLPTPLPWTCGEWRQPERVVLNRHRTAGFRERNSSRGELMGPPLSSWKYESGFLTIFHAGKTYELGYFKLHEEARTAALAFRHARGSTMSRPRRVVRGVRG